MFKIPTKCPVCGGETCAAVVKCKACGTTVNNMFEFSKLEKLDEKQTAFVLAFIESEGSIKEMEKRFDISYPTVKARLAEIKRALNLAEGKSYRQAVLEELEKGDIDVDAAIGLIKKEVE